MHPYLAYEIAVQLIEQQRRDADRARLARQSRAVTARPTGTPMQAQGGSAFLRLRRHQARPAVHGGC